MGTISSVFIVITQTWPEGLERKYYVSSSIKYTTELFNSVSIQTLQFTQSQRSVNFDLLSGQINADGVKVLMHSAA